MSVTLEFTVVMTVVMVTMHFIPATVIWTIEIIGLMFCITEGLSIPLKAKMESYRHSTCSRLIILLNKSTVTRGSH